MVSIALPVELEPFRSKLEATIKPHVEIKTRLTRDASLGQSKFFGFPYLPKNVAYPTTPEGEYLYLLAQINFEEVPHLEGFPEKGILQFYIAADGAYGLPNAENSTSQTTFRIVYFANPDLDEANLVTDFDFLTTIWNYENHFFPFWVCDLYTPHRDDCFALDFSLKSAPISDCDYQFDELIGAEILDVLSENDHALWHEYQKRFVEGHRLGGYPNFAQSDPREFLPREEEPYRLLLQIDSDASAFEQIYIEWDDWGVGNFWIKELDLKQLDFSRVLYNWDCS